MNVDPVVLEVRRSNRRFLSRTLASFGPLAVAALIGGFFFGDARVRILSLLAAFVIVFAVATIYHRRVRLFVTESRFGRRGLLGTWWIPRSDLARGLLVEQLTGRDNKSTRELFLFDKPGARIARISGRAWGNKSVARIAHVLDVPLTTIDRAVSTKELAIIDPRALRSGERHPYLAIVGFTAAVLAVVVVVATVAVNF